MQIDDQQWDVIRKHFPEETPIPGKPGPKPTPAREILEAVLWILNTGAQWAELPQKFPPYQTVHKWFQAWCRDDTLCDILCDLANQLRERGVIDERESFIDVIFSPAKGGGEGVGKTKRGKGFKFMEIVDNHGIPIAVSTHATNHHEVTLVQLTFNFYMIEAMPEKLIGDRAYDSDTLDKELAQDGIDMVAPHRKTVAKRALRMDARFVDTLADGSSNASLNRFNGGEESFLDGSIIWTTS